MKDKAPSLLSLKSVSTIVSESDCYENEIDGCEEVEKERTGDRKADSIKSSEVSTVLTTSQSIEKVNVHKSSDVHFGHNFINCENVQVFEAIPKKGYISKKCACKKLMPRFF